jgi:NhaA family Na+:H+ antiporter
VVGKLLGIAGTTLGVVKARISELPEGMRRSQAWGVASLGGIGFTVSLFVAQLAFGDGPLQEQAKVGIFAGSLLSGLLGAALLLSMARRRGADGS